MAAPTQTPESNDAQAARSHAALALRLAAEVRRLRTAIETTNNENLHLADGENCTLLGLKRSLVQIPNAKLTHRKKRGGWKLQKRTPEQCAAIAARQKAKWASGTRKPTPRTAYEKASKTKLQGFKNGTHGKMSPEMRLLVASKGGRAIQGNPETRANLASHLRTLAANHRGQKNPPGRSEAGENNWKAKWWHIRTPTGENIAGKNLNEIIRRHASLFEPQDVVWKKHLCRASKGIGSLGHTSGTACSWKGWTLIASLENGDLIARNVVLPSGQRLTNNRAKYENKA